MGRKSKQYGFQLIELLVALAIAIIVLMAAYSICLTCRRHYRSQQLLITAQQNLSGAVLVMEQQLRRAGYDPQESGQFGIVDVRRYDLVEASRVNALGHPALFYTYDRNGDGVLEGGARGRNGEHPNFRIKKDANNGAIYLSHDNGSGRRPLAENIEAMGIAYAVDADQDGHLDTWQGSAHVIWAVDSDNDNILDTHIDTNNDGRINEADDANGDGRIDEKDGTPIKGGVELRYIKSVRIWLLAVSSHPIKGRGNASTYVLGDRVMVPSEDNRIWRLMETTIDCRNL